MCPYANRNTVPNQGVYPEPIYDVKSWFDCSELCRESDGCKYWTWSNEAFTCEIMTDGAIDFSNSHNWLVSGARDCMGAHNKISIKFPVTAMQGYTGGQYAFAVAVQVVNGHSVILYLNL